ncbi:MAG: 3-methyl-2-oxobutanoate hydroxymethyltransferase [Acidimicrobiales bacterium]
MNRKLTVADLRAAKGNRILTEVFVTTGDEAAACEAAGIDMLVTPAPFYDRVRRGAPNTFLTVGLGQAGVIASATELLRTAMTTMNDGADAVYTAAGFEWVAELAKQHVPVMGHVGYIPSRQTWTGGPRAIGKTRDEARKVYQDVLAYQEAGAVAVEMEVVPEAVATAIASRVDLTVISLGSGGGCDAQYLFASDILGTTRGHVPRHAKRYADIGAELERIQTMRIEAIARFRADVEGGAYPAKEHLVAGYGDLVEEL